MAMTFYCWDEDAADALLWLFFGPKGDLAVISARLFTVEDILGSEGGADCVAEDGVKKGIEEETLASIGG